MLELGGAFEAVDELKRRLVRSQAERVRRIETGELLVVGVNSFTETEPSPLETADDGAATILKVDPAAEAQLRADVATWRAQRDNAAVRAALDELRRVAADERREPHAGHDRPGPRRRHHRGVGRRPARGVRRVPRPDRRERRGRAPRRRARRRARARPGSWRSARGGPPRLLVAKPGLDGHSNGAEQIAVAARDAGFEVIYQGIRLSPEQIAVAARDEDVDVVGISILSGSHLELVPEVLDRLRGAGVDAPVVVGGIIPPEDAEVLRGKGVAAVFTPKDFELGRIMDELVTLVERHRDGQRSAPHVADGARTAVATSRCGTGYSAESSTEGSASRSASTGLLRLDQRGDVVGDVPHVDVHPRHHRALVEPEHDDLAAVLVTPVDDLVPAGGEPAVLHAEVVLVREEVRDLRVGDALHRACSWPRPGPG